MLPTDTKDKKQMNPDKVKAAFDRGIVLKTVQSVYKLSTTTNNFSLFANLEPSNSDQSYAVYSTNGKSPLTADGYSLAFKVFLLGVDFAQPEYIKPDGSRTRLNAISKFLNLTTVEIKVGDDPLRKHILSDIIDPIPLIVNPLLSSGSVPANTLVQPGIIAQPASSLENERNMIRLPQDIKNDTKISFDFKLLYSQVGAELNDHLIVGKWSLEENSKRRIR